MIVEAHNDARVCRDALAEAGIPAVYSGDPDVFASRGGARLAPPARGVRAAAPLRAGPGRGDHDVLRRDRAEPRRGWRRPHRPGRPTRCASGPTTLRERGLAAVFEAAQVAGLGRRVLGWQGGERHLTDLAHVAQVLHETAQRERLGLPALLDWLRAAVLRARAAPAERNRRLDCDAAAVQIMTVWVSKGLQYPLVYLPFAFNRNIPDARQPPLPPRRRALPRHRRQGPQPASRRSRPWPGVRSPATTSGSPTSP